MNMPTIMNEIPYLTTDQMIEVDRAMIEDFHIELIQMMENAGRNLAHLARERFLEGDPRQKNIVVMAGSGGNGGGALVSARRLANWGASIAVVLTKTGGHFTPIPKHQLSILQHMGVNIYEYGSVNSNIFSRPDLIIDGIIGYSLKGAPRGTAAKLIQWANTQDSPILSLDAPSGVDTTTGAIYDPAINAEATMTLALPKAGLLSHNVDLQVGELYLADISVPSQLYAQPPLNIDVEPIFAASDIVRIR